MQRLSAAIKEAIESKYGSVAKFSRLIDIPYSTLNNILKNGFDNSKSVSYTHLDVYKRQL